MHPSLTKEQFNKIRRDARVAAVSGDTSAAFNMLRPALQDMALAAAAAGDDPFSGLDWHDMSHASILEAWRDGIVEWREAGCQGMAPGQIALSSLLDEVAEQYAHGWQPAMDADYLGRRISTYVEFIARTVFRDRERAADIYEAIAETVEASWYDDAMARPIPPTVYTELCWVPNWNGRSLDGMLNLALNGTRYRACYWDEILPSSSLSALLEFVNLSSRELSRAVREHRSDTWKAFRQNMRGYSVRKAQPDRPPLVTAEQLVEIVENAGASLPVPMVHVHVQLSALLAHDPRLPMELSLHRGGVHFGMHDVLHGSGYMDFWRTERPVVVPPFSTGFGWPGRWPYGIDSTYGIVTSFFRCTPRSFDHSGQRDVAV